MTRGEAMYEMPHLGSYNGAIIDLINKLFDEHGTQLKAKDVSIAEYSQLLTKFEKIFDEKNKLVFKLIAGQKRNDKKLVLSLLCCFGKQKNIKD